jgi:hypothetical protein
MGFPACPVPYWCRAWAEPGPGDVFREYKWRPDGKWQRVTGPDATAEGAKQHLPNSVNTIRIDDLDGAVKVEAYIEMLLCHGGTVDKKIRVNANPKSALMQIRGCPLVNHLLFRAMQDKVRPIRNTSICATQASGFL